MPKTTIAGNSYVITSDVSMADLETVKKYRPAALTLADEETKETYFRVGSGNSSSVTDHGISFSGVTNMTWNTNVQLLVADAVGCECSPAFIAEFIAGATKCGFFDKTVLDAFGVLTSAEFQRQYIRMMNCRDYVQIISEYWLINTNDKKDVPASVIDKLDFKNITNTDNPDKNTDNLQSKGKENKGKENKSSSPQAATRDEFLKILTDKNFSSELENKVREWIAYKKEQHNYKYKPIGLKNLLSEIQNNINKYGVEAIIHAICNHQ
ncbi:MAG: DUF4373 domain-containing protein [Oscillospiraceae bacterium]|nr:DUF4373 domain-containing protein [Oscillospiraceae bacterium]